MAEFSLFWTTGTTGDGTNPYTESQLFSWLRRTFNSDSPYSGPLKGYNSGLAVTAGTGSVTVGTGAAYVYGIPYENDAPLSIPIPTPTANTRFDRIVLRADWSARTVRITRLAGTEGAGVPNLTQNPGAIYEVPLAIVRVTTSGTITVTDNRYFCRFATEVAEENLADGAVTEDKIADDAIITTKIANYAVGEWQIAAGAVTTAKIADAAVVTAKIANGAIFDNQIASSAAISQSKISNSARAIDADKVDGVHGTAMMQLIQEIVLSSSAASVSFSSVPQTFRHLLLIISARSNNNNIDDVIWILPNNDTTSNYIGVGHVYGGSTTHRLDNSVGATKGFIGYAARSGANAGSFAQIQTLINNYRDTDKYKMWISRSIQFTTGLDLVEYDFSGVWKSTNAITSLTIVADNTFAAGSTFSLYGLP